MLRARCAVVIGWMLSLCSHGGATLVALARALGVARVLVVAGASLVLVMPAAIAAVDRTYTPVPRVADLPEDQLPDPRGAVQVLQARERGQREAEERARHRATGEERDARARSRSAYRGRGRDTALVVARRELSRLMDEPVWAPPKLANGEKIVGYASDHLIQIRRDGEKTGSVIATPFPARVADEKDVKRPIDLGLAEGPDAFETKNSLVDVRLPKQLSAGVTLGDTGVSLRPAVTGTASSGVEQAGKVFWSDVAADTDFMVAPLPNGIQTFHLLRSADAPQELALMLDLPADTTLRYAKAPTPGFGPPAKPNSAGIEIVRGSTVVGTISPPVAFDADNEPVAVQLRLGEGRVTLDVAHRDADVKYPLTVDPVFVGYVRDDNTWRDGYPSFAGWQYLSVPSGYFPGLAGNSIWGNGLYVTAYANGGYCCNWFGQWIYYAPGTAYIYRADLTGMYYAHSGSSYYLGIHKANYGWQSLWSTSTAMNNGYTTLCVSDCGTTSAHPGNSLAFGMIMYGPTGPSGAVSYLGRAYLYLSDNEAPVITSVSPGAPTGWVRPEDLTTMTAHINASDTGLGIAGEDVVIGSTQVGPYVGINCGDRNLRCPNTTSAPHLYDVSDYIEGRADGTHQVAARVVDVVGRTTSSSPWPIKIDSTEPDVALTGGLAGMNAKDLTLDEYKLVVNADDTNPWGASLGSAGVKSIQVKLDGEQQTINDRGASGPACPGDGCALRHEWTLQPFTDRISVGTHTISVETRDFAGNLTTDTLTVQIPRGVMKSPRSGDISEGTFKLRAVAKSGGFSYGAFQYRTSPSEPWTTITSNLTDGDSPVTGPVALNGEGSTPTLVWNTAAALSSDSPVQLRAIFGTAASGSGAPADPNASVIVNASYRPNGIGADYARQDLAPGEVNLITGNFVMTGQDVSIKTPTGDLTVSRTYASRLPAGQTGPFGPGWLAAGTIDAAGANYVNITEQGANAVLALVDGTTLQFASSGSATYLSPPGYEDLTLTKTAGTFTLKDTAANETTFTLPSGATNDWRPATIKTAADNSTNTVTYTTANGQLVVSKIRGPLPTGVANCTPNAEDAIPAGCRELRFTYATTTTATGTTEAQWGDYNGRLKTVTFHSGDPGMSATGIDLATYRYDNAGGRLRAQWDPRVTPALKTTYDYNSDGLLSKFTPPGEQPWSLSYQAKVGEPATTGRLRAITRTGPSGTATRTVVYDVALAGSDAPYGMDVASVAQWAQTDSPTTATAIFPADSIPGGDAVTSTTKSTVYYLNASGEIVNVAHPGGHITTTEYDEQHNVVRTLTAANRARALQASDKPARAREIDTQIVYAANGLEKIEELGPRHEIVVGGQTVQARQHTVTQYDADDLHLPLRVSTGALIDGHNGDSDIRVTAHAYNSTGKKLRKPTSTTVDPAGLNLTTNYSYDPTGQEIARTSPKGSAATDAAYTSTTTLYAAAGTGACANKPEWAGLPCRTVPGAQPGGSLPDIPIQTISYNKWQQPTTINESVGATHSRTTTTTYDAAGRVDTQSIAATTGTSLPTVTHGYSATTGRELTISTTSPAKTITRSYDSLGRLTSYQDGDGALSTITDYDVRDRVITTSDGKGAQTRGYDPVSGLLISLDDSQAGQFAASYDADGTITGRGLPNGLTATSTIDEAGNETRLVYTKASNCGTSCTWLDNEAPVTAHGQRFGHTTTIQTGMLSQATYVYDAAGRLTRTNDTSASGGCTIREYGYDANSNRTSLTAKPPGAGGACQVAATGTTTTNTYDAADRLINPGVDYDAFGRTLTVPAANAGGSTLASTYYSNDFAKTLSQDGITHSYTLDPARRIQSRVTSGTTSATETHHYSDDSDSPSWIANSSDGTIYTRQIEGIDGDLAAVRDSSGTRLQLVNLHGDVIAEASTSSSATTLLRSGDSDEFGVPRSLETDRNQWLGGKQRPTELKRGVIAMGVRTYVPSLGRFLQTDPVRGGSCSPYDYVCQDPITGFDLDGHRKRRRYPCTMPRGDDPSWLVSGGGSGVPWFTYSLAVSGEARCRSAVADLSVKLRIVGGTLNYDLIPKGEYGPTTSCGRARSCVGGTAGSGIAFSSCGTGRGKVIVDALLSWGRGRGQHRTIRRTLKVTTFGTCF